MENQNILLTLGVGVSFAFTLFFVFYKALNWSSKAAALMTILITQAIYIPLSIKFWPGMDVFAIHFALFTMAAYGLGIITSHRNSRIAAEGQTDNGWFHWAPATIVGFFLILVVVDSFIVTLSNSGASAEFVRQYLPEPKGGAVGKEVTSAFSGTVQNDFQKDIQQYNQYVDQLRQQKTLGWRVTDGWLAVPKEGTPTQFRLHVIDDEGMPITGAQVSVKLLFTADKSKDMDIILPEVEPGFYGQPIVLPQSGKWLVSIKIMRNNDVYEAQGETTAIPANAG